MLKDISMELFKWLNGRLGFVILFVIYPENYMADAYDLKAIYLNPDTPNNIELSSEKY